MKMNWKGRYGQLQGINCLFHFTLRCCQKLTAGWIKKIVGRKIKKDAEVAMSSDTAWAAQLHDNDFTHIGHLCDTNAAYLQTIVQSGRAANLLHNAAMVEFSSWKGQWIDRPIRHS